jgi:glycosyltransferase involved in cell wall biosynthesis
MNNDDSLVAIITRTKNRTLLLDRCIRTVLAQTSSTWIHVIVNDGGDPAAVENLVAPYQEQYAGRLTIIHNEHSRGMEAASNIGIRASRSRYLVILDDDDTWDPTFLQEMVLALEADTWQGTRGIFCHTEIIYEQIHGTQILETGRKDFNGWLKSIDLLRLFSWNRFTPVCFLFERAALEEVGLFDETLPVNGDWEFNIRFLVKFDIAVYPKYLAFWHQRPKARPGLGNSVIADSDLHELYRSRLVNKWLRRSLQRGTTDFGELFSFAMILEYEHTMDTRFYHFGKRFQKNIVDRLYSGIRRLFRRETA